MIDKLIRETGGVYRVLRKQANTRWCDVICAGYNFEEVKQAFQEAKVADDSGAEFSLQLVTDTWAVNLITS